MITLYMTSQTTVSVPQGRLGYHRAWLKPAKIVSLNADSIHSSLPNLEIFLVPALLRNSAYYYFCINFPHHILKPRGHFLASCEPCLPVGIPKALQDTSWHELHSQSLSRLRSMLVLECIKLTWSCSGRRLSSFRRSTCCRGWLLRSGWSRLRC